jgi:Ca2+:H+ antiporter
VPLAWLIGEATEHAAEHTGAGVGGFLNASFGNAPELIIAMIAVADGLPDVVRGSLTGSVVSNILLVLGAAMIAGGDGRVDARSLRWQLGAVFAAALLLIVPSAPAWNGTPYESHTLFLISIPVSLVLLTAYLVITIRNLRIHRAAERDEAAEHAWPLSRSIAALAVATIATALVSEILVKSLDHFGEAVGLSEFFLAVVVVAIVGNAAEHGGAIVIAHNGKMRLATEIAISSAAQVALLIVPVVTLLSLLFTHPLALAFRWTELFAMGGAAVLVALTVRDGRSRRKEGWLLVGAYTAAAIGFLLGGGR